MPQLKMLWEIQDLDVQKRALEKELREGQISNELRALKKEIEEGRAAYKKLKEKHNFLKKDLKDRELEVAAEREQLDNLGQKLYSGAITNVKEINTTTKKIENIKDMVNNMEDKMLDIMERMDAQHNKLEEMKAQLNGKADDYRRLHRSYLDNQQEVKQQLDQIPLTRQKLLDKVDPDLWQKYMEMKKKYDDPLAKVEKGICRGCRVAIPFNDLRLLKQGDDRVFCSLCGRMLMWEK